MGVGHGPHDHHRHNLAHKGTKEDKDDKRGHHLTPPSALSQVNTPSHTSTHPLTPQHTLLIHKHTLSPLTHYSLISNHLLTSPHQHTLLHPPSTHLPTQLTTAASRADAADIDYLLPAAHPLTPPLTPFYTPFTQLTTAASRADAADIDYLLPAAKVAGNAVKNSPEGFEAVWSLTEQGVLPVAASAELVAIVSEIAAQAMMGMRLFD